MGIYTFPPFFLEAAKELGKLRIEDLFWIGFVGGGISLLFAFIQLGRLLPLPVGDEPAQGLAAALRKGTNAYLKWQFLLSLLGLALVFGLLEGLAYFHHLGQLVPPALLSGGICALLTGVSGAKLTAAAGPRAAEAAGKRLDRGVDAALSAGSVASFLAIGLSLIHLTGWFFLLKYQMGYGPEEIAQTLLFFGLGSALVSALFHMGNLFARGAGMAVETVDREMGLPPDDPKNPAAIADRVGHGVGISAGMSAGLSCSYENMLFSALFLGASAFASDDMAWNAMLLPLAIAAAGVLSSLIGFLTVRPRERGDRYSLPWCLRIAALVPALLTAAACLPITYFLTGSWVFCLPVFAGLGAGLLTSLTGEYFTTDTYKPARSLVNAADTGTVAAVTGGLGAGLSASVLPILLTAAALAFSFWTAGGAGNFSKGIYGIALAGVGMLSVSGVSQAASLCGPIGDCGAHAASLIDAEEASRRRADILAAIGASAANGGKCLAAGAAAFTGLSLFLCLAETFSSIQPGLELTHMEPLLLVGILLGGTAVVLFLGLLLLAVRGTAKAVLLQARHQFQDNEGLIDGTEDPDYAACVTKCSLRAMLGILPPILLALLSPIAAGILLGPQGLMGFLGCILLLSLTLVPFFTLSGGILGGARRYVESGRKGGRGSDCHRATLTAERALIPLSQVAAPALLAFLKLAVTLSLLGSVVIVTFNLPALLG